jgi:hypothetical protein
MPTSSTLQTGYQLNGLVERVTFFSEESGFCVLRVKADAHRDLVTVVGSEWIGRSGSSGRVSPLWKNVPNNHGASMSTAQRRVRPLSRYAAQPLWAATWNVAISVAKNGIASIAAAIGIAPNASRWPGRNGLKIARLSSWRLAIFTSFLPCRKTSPTPLTKTRNWSWASFSGSPPKH